MAEIARIDKTGLRKRIYGKTRSQSGIYFGEATVQRKIDLFMTSTVSVFHQQTCANALRHNIRQ